MAEDETGQVPLAPAEPPAEEIPEQVEGEAVEKPDLAKLLEGVDLKEFMNLPEVQSEVERRAAKHARSQTDGIREMITGLNQRIEDMGTHVSQRQEDQQTLSWWNGLDNDQRAQVIAERKDVIHRVSDAERRSEGSTKPVQQGGDKPDVPTLQAWMKMGFDDLKTEFPEWQGMSDEEFRVFVTENKGSTYAATVVNLARKAIEPGLKSKVNAEAEARSREEMAKRRPAEGQPVISPSSGGAGDEFTRLESKIADGTATTEDYGRYAEMSAQRGL